MADFPLLVFPESGSAARSSLPSGFPRFHRPDHQRQGERLGPVFDRLDAAFDARRVELTTNLRGMDPNMVLVFETVGSVEDFANAVARISGLEWMGETDLDELKPDDDFYDPNYPDKPLSGRLYLIMTNRRALDELLSLWRRYKANASFSFPRGMAKFRELFLSLRDLRLWSSRDRLEETGILEQWQDELLHDPDRVERCEIELWYRSTPGARSRDSAEVEGLVQAAGGTVLHSSQIAGIHYHGMLAELPARTVREILEHRSADLVKCDGIMFFRPSGQIGPGESDAILSYEEGNSPETQVRLGEPLVALLDGVPLENHLLLGNNLNIDDPDSWTQEYPVSHRRHGTAMASLILHGDLGVPSEPPKRRLYVRPIMMSFPGPSNQGRESLPADVLAVDLVHRAVKRIFEGDLDSPASAPTVRVINFSIGDASRPFAQFMSPLARLIDWLSFKYKVLFIVSAGNHSIPIQLRMTRDQFYALPSSGQTAEIVKALYVESRHRRILSPAETLNGLTVGALQNDSSTVDFLGDRIEPVPRSLPSPISAFGSGHRRSLKPDLIFTGGRQLFRPPFVNQDPLRLEVSNGNGTPGVKVAAPGAAEGDRNGVTHIRGTSVATALTTRAAVQLYDVAVECYATRATADEFRAFSTVLLKAMIVHGCDWDASGAQIESILRTPDNVKRLPGLVSRWQGYGVPDFAKVRSCTPDRATILGSGRLKPEEANLFHIPLPPSLSSAAVWRRLTVTLAWSTPIAPSTQKYRMAHLWFRVLGHKFAEHRANSDWQGVRRGTVQHEIFESDFAEPFADGDTVVIEVNCRSEAADFDDPVPFGLVVSIETREGLRSAVYQEIRERIPTLTQVRPSTRVNT